MKDTEDTVKGEQRVDGQSKINQNAGPEKPKHLEEMQGGGAAQGNSSASSLSPSSKQNEKAKKFFTGWTKKKKEPPAKRGRDKITQSPVSEDGYFLTENETERLVENMIEEKLEAVTNDMDQLTKAYKEQCEEIDDLKTENNELCRRVSLLEGRCARSDKLITDLKEEMLQTQSRQMKDNLLF